VSDCPTRCPWCGKHGGKPSEWEQQSLRGPWLWMCNRCATKRLNNPWNALYGMRKVTQ